MLHARGAGTDLTFDLVTIARTRTRSPPTTARWLFLAFAIAFAVKVPLFPVHTWLPDAHTEAPTAGSVILAGVMLKLGTYGFLRFGLYLFPEASAYFAPAAGHPRGDRHHLRRRSCATMQKRPQAAGRLLVGGPPRLHRRSARSRSPPRASQGSVLQMVNHGISTGALFLLVGMIYERRHTRRSPSSRASRRWRRSSPACSRS